MSCHPRSLFIGLMICAGCVCAAFGQERTDCNGNGIPDDQDLADCDGASWCRDCNGNGVLDYCDVAVYYTSDDCHSDGIPDECQLWSGPAYFEAFDDAVPPAGWTAVVHSSSTWRL